MIYSNTSILINQNNFLNPNWILLHNQKKIIILVILSENLMLEFF